jgi:hypothetical protein
MFYNSEGGGGGFCLGPKTGYLTEMFHDFRQFLQKNP